MDLGVQREKRYLEGNSTVLMAYSMFFKYGPIKTKNLRVVMRVIYYNRLCSHAITTVPPKALEDRNTIIEVHNEFQPSSHINFLWGPWTRISISETHDQLLFLRARVLLLEVPKDRGLVKKSTVAGTKGWHQPITYSEATFVIRKQNILLKPFELLY